MRKDTSRFWSFLSVQNELFFCVVGAMMLNEEKADEPQKIIGAFNTSFSQSYLNFAHYKTFYLLHCTYSCVSLIIGRCAEMNIIPSFSVKNNS